jgi:atypical dual specificity phosphatase
MAPPTSEQLELCMKTIRRGREQEFGVGVHCYAGVGRTGTVLAAWFVSEGMSPNDAVIKIRELRPGSIETPEQERAIELFAKRS